jgi:Flp pilus assembly protein TadD
MARTMIRAGAMLVLAMALAGCAILRLDFRGHRDVVAGTGAEDMVAARRALQQRRWPVAVARAEQAVALDGADGERRALLGTAYLRAGRFHSAAQAFADALALRQADGRTALNLALAQIASGQGEAAQATLARYAALIPAADRGLALALGGTPQQGVEVLMAAMRVPGADARTRQNLALALALAGEWPDAFFLVGLDRPPAAARQRILDWMRFARPQGPADQVAALLAITPAIDPGQPVALALHQAPAPAGTAASIDRYMPGPADEATVTAALAGVAPPRHAR